ncbi:MAG: SlyX family protein [Spirochaetales bacterium]|nr:SlyX family protein [Spirochaetales bacterium]
MTEDRIITLETKISYQEDLIQELSRIIADQEARLARQEERSKLLAHKVATLTELLEEAPADRKPPHY